MRGRREPQVSMLTFIDLETRVADHPLRTINRLADRALAQLSPDRMYAQVGRLPFLLSGSEGFPTHFPVLGAQ